MINKVDYQAQKDTTLTPQDIELFRKDIINTLRYADLLQMPEMDFKKLSQCDPEIYALFN